MGTNPGRAGGYVGCSPEGVLVVVGLSSRRSGVIAFQCCVMRFALGVIMLAIRRFYAILWRACSWMRASLRLSWKI